MLPWIYGVIKLVNSTTSTGNLKFEEEYDAKGRNIC
jgi:hypothetical protein